MAVTTGFQGRTFDVPRTGVPCIGLPSRAPCAAADAVFADAKAFLSSSEARQMSESELERELHRRRQDLVRKLLQGHRDQRSPKEAAGPAEDTSGVECSEPHEHESHEQVLLDCSAGLAVGVGPDEPPCPAVAGDCRFRQCTGSIAPGPGRIRDFRHRLLSHSRDDAEGHRDPPVPLCSGIVAHGGLFQGLETRLAAPANEPD